MSIRDNVIARKREMLLEIDAAVVKKSADIQRLSLAAVKGGQGSDAWKAYMSLFVDAGNTKQLARLLGKDSTAAKADMNEARAYLVADGTCGVDTVTNFGKGASLVLDLGVENEDTVEV